LLGEEGRASLAPLGVATLATMPRFRLVASRMLGPDVMNEYAKE
jgi:diaminohydroxyphosphoribosylaminopyrimidine deaminase/5-amino-6-(5-phosphoribosylamino)uracil reductase